MKRRLRLRQRVAVNNAHVSQSSNHSVADPIQSTDAIMDFLQHYSFDFERREIKVGVLGRR